MNTMYAPVRDRLIEERTTLLTSIGGMDANSDALKASSVEMRKELLSEGDTVSVERHILSKLSDAARGTVLEIEAALSRIDEGTYGACSGCGEQIPVERLEVRPHAKHCVKCASKR